MARLLQKVHDVPHPTFKLPIFRATSEAIHGMNTMTDFSVARSMFLKVRRTCVLLQSCSSTYPGLPVLNSHQEWCCATDSYVE